MTTTTGPPPTVTKQPRARPRHTRPNRPTRPCVLARYYDPTIGRFTAVDPIVDTEQPGSLDRFGYGLDSPVTLSDPTGLWMPVGDNRRSGSYDARRTPLVDTGTNRATRLRLPGHSYRAARPIREPGPATAPKKPTVDTAPNPDAPDWEYTKDFHIVTTEGDVVDAVPGRGPVTGSAGCRRARTRSSRSPSTAARSKWEPISAFNRRDAAIPSR